MTPDTMIDAVTLTRQGGRVMRGHTNFAFHTENNAEHTYNVLNLLTLLHPSPSANLLRAALWHDVPERITGDVPSSAKRRWPEIKKALLSAEREIVKEYGLDVQLTDDELHWLKAADKLDYMLHCQEEAERGNREYAIKAARTRLELVNAQDVPEPIKEYADAVCAREGRAL